MAGLRARSRARGAAADALDAALGARRPLGDGRAGLGLARGCGARSRGVSPPRGERRSRGSRAGGGRCTAARSSPASGCATAPSSTTGSRSVPHRSHGSSEASSTGSPTAALRRRRAARGRARATSPRPRPAERDRAPTTDRALRRERRARRRARAVPRLRAHPPSRAWRLADRGDDRGLPRSPRGRRSRSRADAARRRRARTPPPSRRPRTRARRAPRRVRTVRFGAFVVLDGEMGIGKTRLADELVARVRDDGVVAATVRCIEDESELAYGCAIELVRSVLREGDAERSIRHPRPRRPGCCRSSERRRRLRSMGLARRRGSSTGSRACSSKRRAASGRAARRGRRPLGRRVLPRGARLPRSAARDRPVLVLATWRTEETPADHPARRILADAARDGSRLSSSPERPPPTTSPSSRPKPARRPSSRSGSMRRHRGSPSSSSSTSTRRRTTRRSPGCPRPARSARDGSERSCWAGRRGGGRPRAPVRRN